MHISLLVLLLVCGILLCRMTLILLFDFLHFLCCCWASYFMSLLSSCDSLFSLPWFSSRVFIYKLYKKNNHDTFDNFLYHDFLYLAIVVVNSHVYFIEFWFVPRSFLLSLFISINKLTGVANDRQWPIISFISL
jgi:hypothetical protein